ncbi:MAG: DUF4149 domain-containing protein [Myxococcota bacterium]
MIQILRSQLVLRSALWLSLGSWVGSWAFFAFVVSRIAFQVLPGDVAGDLAGDLLAVLHYWGAGAGLVAAAAAIGLGRRGLPVFIPIGLALVCLASETWLSPAVAAVRPSSLGVGSTAELQQRFGTLHRLSLGLFMAMHLVSAILIVIHARLDAQEAQKQHET